MVKPKLGLYRAKRDFKKTSEPRGVTGIAPAEYPRFVIQKHAATRLHYDLRLEVGGAFKSWAVTKGPSLDPAEKRLAVEVEDHPLDYGDFEGTIPKGEYGGGTVMVWDRGFWTPEGDANAEEALRSGELKFTLAGQKLQGDWVLVRMRGDRQQENRINWLLIKHRDGFARADDADALLDDDRSVASGRSMEEIAAGKGRAPRRFVTGRARTIGPNAVWHSSEKGGHRHPPSKSRARRRATRACAVNMPAFIAPQLCQPVARPPDGEGWVHEIKFDGYRMQLRVENGAAVLRTRSGLDWTGRFESTVHAAVALPDAIIDGEIVALDVTGAPDFTALQAALSEKRSQHLVYFAFDLLHAGDEDLRARPLTERKERLKQIVSKHAHNPNNIRYVEHFRDSGDAVLKSACRMNLEGIVSKRLDAPYRSGRTTAWTKAKCRGGHEVVIGGWSGSKTNLRSLLVGVRRGRHLVHVGRVGTGFNAHKAKDLLKKLNALATKTSPFSGKDPPHRMPDWTWVRPKLVAEIEFAGWTGAGMVRQAAFKALREDKPASDVRAERPASAAITRNAAANLLPTPIPSERNNVLGVVISRADKALWPKYETTGPITKLDLARYHESVGYWMLLHLKGRPCSVIRAPDGLTGQRFFQRHAMRGTSSLVTLTKVSGDRAPYLQIDSIEALIAMAQIAAVEYHPWNCEPGSPDVPGRLVFDLDPAPDVPFTSTITAARELSTRLEALGLVTFCKTTGGKGLHVVTPLKVTGRRMLDWDEAKAFAKAVCVAMAGDSPDRYVVNMAKRIRHGRIFLDYLRNDRMSTAVAPLSPRLRPEATVSMPLHWSQVRKDLDPLRYTIRTAPALLEKHKPWADYCQAERPLAEAIEKFVKSPQRKKGS